MACFARIAPSPTCTVEPEDDTRVVEWVAIPESDRGQGPARSLLVEILEQGHRRGYRKSQTSLIIGNGPAQRVYTSEGFEAAYRSPGSGACSVGRNTRPHHIREPLRGSGTEREGRRKPWIP